MQYAKSMKIGVFFLFLTVMGISNVWAADETPKITYGWVEKVSLFPYHQEITAKLDTGAKSASLYAQDITYFQHKGQPWVKFTVPLDHGAEKVVFKKALYDITKIKLRAPARESLHQTSVKRPVVLMSVCLGDTRKVIRVNLADRKRFLYPMLLGRDAINRFHGNVDTQKKFTHKPSC